MFKVVIFLSFFAFDMPQAGYLDVVPTDSSMFQSCDMLLVSNEYTTTRDSMLDILEKNYKFKDIKITKEVCTFEAPL